jgi:Sulfotransferase family
MTASSEGRVPDFFIVGHPKSGTTALYEMLRSHPQIYMPDFKEPRFFASDLPSRFNEKPSGERPETFDDYLSLFNSASPAQRVGEASTAYIWSKTAAGLIAEAQPSARIIVILREPASFVQSMHLQLLQIRVEKERSLRKALALEDARRQGRCLPAVISRWPQVLLYTDRVRYVEQLRRYHALFAPEQVLVLIYDDFRRDNDATVRSVLRFLDVDDTVPIQSTQANPTVRMRSVRLDETVRAVSVGRGPLARAVRSSVKALTPAGVRLQAHRAIRRRVVFGAPRAPDESVMLELRRRFEAEVVAASEYLGRDLVTLWGYDSLG